MISSANCIWNLPRKGVLVPRTGALDPGASTTSTSSPETRDEKYWFWKRKRHNLDLSLNMIRVIYILNFFTNLRNYFYYQNCTLLMGGHCWIWIKWKNTNPYFADLPRPNLVQVPWTQPFLHPCAYSFKVISLGIDDKTVRRIRDVYRWSWFLSIPDPGSRGSKKAPDPGSATLVKSWVAYPDLVIFQFFPDPAKCSVFYRVRICNHALNLTGPGEILKI